MNTARLRGKMAELNITGEAAAKNLGIASKTFYSKMSTGKFTVDEAARLINLLGISDPNEAAHIFLISQ